MWKIKQLCTKVNDSAWRQVAQYMHDQYACSRGEECWRLCKRGVGVEPSWCYLQPWALPCLQLTRLLLAQPKLYLAHLSNLYRSVFLSLTDIVAPPCPPHLEITHVYPVCYSLSQSNHSSCKLWAFIQNRDSFCKNIEYLYGIVLE